MIYYLFISVMAIGIYHSIHKYWEDNFFFYFSSSKVKQNDKLFELIEKSTVEKEASAEESTGEGEAVEGEAVGEEVEGEVEGKNRELEREGEDEELFHFIDGL